MLHCAGSTVAVRVVNRYNTYDYGGAKHVVLSENSWVGGKNNFLGILLIVLGALALLIAFAFFIAYAFQLSPFSLPSWSFILTPFRTAFNSRLSTADVCW